MMKGKSVEL